MQRKQLSALLKDYDPGIQRVLEEALQIEQQFITKKLQTNSQALKDIVTKLDNVIEEVVKS